VRDQHGGAEPELRTPDCFVWIEDYEQAQKLMNRQQETDWAALLNGFRQPVEPDSRAAV
jgi:hypothetical protein